MSVVEKLGWSILFLEIINTPWSTIKGKGIVAISFGKIFKENIKKIIWLLKGYLPETQRRYSSKNHTNECYSFQGKHEQEMERPFIAGIPEPSSLKTNLDLHHLVCFAHTPPCLRDFKPLVGMCYFLSFQWRLFVSQLGCEIIEDFISTFNGSMVAPLYDDIEILDKHFLWRGQDRDTNSRSWQIVLAIWKKVGTFYFCSVVLERQMPRNKITE